MVIATTLMLRHALQSNSLSKNNRLSRLLVPGSDTSGHSSVRIGLAARTDAKTVGITAIRAPQTMYQLFGKNINCGISSNTKTVSAARANWLRAKTSSRDQRGSNEFSHHHLSTDALPHPLLQQRLMQR